MPKSPVNREEQRPKNTPDMIENWLKRVDKARKSGHTQFREPSPNSLDPTLDCLKEMKVLLETIVQQNDQILAAVTSTSTSLQPLPQMRTQAPMSFMPGLPEPTHSNQSSIPLASYSTNAGHTLLTGQALFSSTPFSVPKKTFELQIGNGKTIIYCAEDLRDDCDYRWPDATPEEYMTKLWRIWDDEDQHWMSDPNTVILLSVAGEPIALKYWRGMWSAARKPFPPALSTSWHMRKCLMEELKKYPSVHTFLEAYTQPCGRPSTLRQITNAIKLQGSTN